MESHSSNALVIVGLNDFNALSNIGLGNYCIVFECNNINRLLTIAKLWMI